MNTVKSLREKMGHTQSELAEKSGLSLRTIQRLEASGNPPKGHSLAALAKVFKLTPSELQKAVNTVRLKSESEQNSIKLINLSVLAFFLFPFGNIILPILVWRKRNQSESVDKAGKIIINFQILWTIVMCFALCLAPFIDWTLPAHFSLTLFVLFIALAINLVTIFLTAQWIQKDQIHRLKLPISLM